MIKKATSDNYAVITSAQPDKDKVQSEAPQSVQPISAQK
jgi:hypothetical protein